MKIRGQAINFPAIEFSLVIGIRELATRPVDDLMANVDRMIRMQIESAKRHYANGPPAELTRAVEEINQITQEER